MIKEIRPFDTFLETELNDAQKEAVTHESGSLLVVAGAGSGKTRVITARITNLIINKNISASHIIALTFTNKAATEMKERIASFLDQHTHLPFVGTFHSYCVQLLKKNSLYLETPFFSILDEEDKQKLIKSIVQKHALHKQISPKNVAYSISLMKNHTIDTEKPAKDKLGHPLYEEIYEAYEREKRASKCLDFDDLLLQVVSLFKKNPTIKKEFQETIRHILVDEYQDTNSVQHELLKLMALNNKTLAIHSVCAVGDEDQSIYSWRGATVSNMHTFKTVFPDTKIIKIEQNYRSAQQILSLANSVIQNNTQRTPKKLWSKKTGKDLIRRLICLTEYQEARAIAQLILTAKTKYKFGEIALLYRTHSQSRALEEALLKESIPYKIVGGIQFYERMEIKDLLAYLKIIANPFDRTSFFRIINVPTRGLGAKFESDFYERWSNEPFANWQEVIKLSAPQDVFAKTKIKALDEFINIFDSIDPHSRPSAALEQILSRSNYIRYLKDSYETQEAVTRTDNVKELIEAVKYFESNGICTISHFLDEVALMQDKMSKQNRNEETVSLMTLHAAKGLEFPLVILPGLEEDILPTARSLQNDDAIEEERRLFYVGITRAMKHLLITHAKHRYSYGQMTDQYVSRFIAEISRDLAPYEDCSHWNNTQINQFFSDWLSIQQQTFSIYIPGQQTTSFHKRIEKKEQEQSVLKWRKNQTVSHAKYGVGIIQDIETKQDNTKHMTVRFKSGVKKIVSSFLTLI